MYDKFYNGLTGDIVTPCDKQYDKARQIWNRAIQKFPSIIVYCYNNNDVGNAICFAIKNNIEIRIRTGGHNYEGYSVGNCILVIDISRMNKLELDENRRVLKAQGGVINTQVYELLGNKGYPFPSGTCPTVGLAGLILGGGWGLSCRYFGLACDSLLSIDIVNYEGKVVTANEYINSDLFWACKGGGGGNFGVVTSMTFRIPNKVESVCLVEFYLANAMVEDMEQFLKIWQNWLKNLDERMTVVSRLYNSPEDGMAIYGNGIFYGSAYEAQILLDNFNNIYGMQISVRSMSFIEAIEIIESSYPNSQMFKSTGRFVQRNYNNEEVENISNILTRRPIGSVYAAISLYALGGKVTDIGRTQTAFFYRNSKYIMGIQSVWENPKYANDNIGWVKENFKYIESITKGSYINFPFSGLECYQRDYYGGNADKLIRINQRYDPFNVFKFPQSIN